MSLALIVERDAPAIWRGPIIMKVIGQFVKDVDWGELDYFLVDLPPGTGDAQLSLAQTVHIRAAIIVTTPQEVAVGDFLRGAKMFEGVGVPGLGVVENMSYFACPHCGERKEIFLARGGHRLPDELGVPLLVQGPRPAPPAAAAYFAERAGRDSTDAAPVTFEASAYIWWAAALENDAYEAVRIDSLLDVAIARARATSPGPAHDFWLATALGYRARQRDLHGHSWGAAKDGKAMRDAYARVLAVDSSCTDCYLGLGVYRYGLARASALARLVAKIVGLGSGNAERGIAYMRRAAAEGDLARVEAGWVLAAALVREAARDPVQRPALERDARDEVVRLASRYPGNPVFHRFLRETAQPAP